MRWTPPEVDQLEHLAGNVPFPTLLRHYNSWASSHGHPTRSRDALVHALSSRGLSARAIGDWLSTGTIADVLGIRSDSPRRWVTCYGLPGRQYRFWWYVRRRDLVRFARRRPDLFGGIQTARLVQLLEDERLAEEIAQGHPRRISDRRSVRTVEAALVFPSIREAARRMGVTRQTVSFALRTGCRAAGYHWEWV